MARDDSILYTGATSATFRNKKQINQEKIQKKAEMIPSAKIVYDLIEKEKQNNADINSLIIRADSSVEDVKSVLLAKKMFDTYLSELQNKLKIILRAKEK
jgi:hypothetical protein